MYLLSTAVIEDEQVSYMRLFAEPSYNSHFFDSILFTTQLRIL